MTEPPTIDEIVGTLGRLYSSYGLSPPFNLRRAAADWTGIPLSDIVAAVELHMLHHRRLYAAGSGCAYFHLVRRAVADLRDKHSRADDARPGPSVKRGAARSSSRSQRPAVIQLHRGAGFTEGFIDDDEDVSKPGAPQPFFAREPRGAKVDYVGNLEDDDPGDA